MIGNPKLKDMCMGCFEGKYKTGDIDEKMLKKNAEARREHRACAYVDGEKEEDQMKLV